MQEKLNPFKFQKISIIWQGILAKIFQTEEIFNKDQNELEIQ